MVETDLTYGEFASEACEPVGNEFDEDARESCEEMVLKLQAGDVEPDNFLDEFETEVGEGSGELLQDALSMLE